MLACYMLAFALGLDYTLFLTSAPTFLSRLDPAINNNGSAPELAGTAATDFGKLLYILVLSLWSLGQFFGCLLALVLPSCIGFRNAFLVFAWLSVLGDLQVCGGGACRQAPCKGEEGEERRCACICLCAVLRCVVCLYNRVLLRQAKLPFSCPALLCG